MTMRLTNALAWCLITVFALFFLCSVTAFAGHEGAVDETPQKEVPFDIPVEKIVQYLAPMNELIIFPCSDCHDEDWEPDPTRRELDEPHNEVPEKFINHDTENRWCLDCHSATERDKLRLINGTLVEFKEYYKLCAQCHRKIFRKWKMGVHGKRTGLWNGKKEYMHCAQCHDPHNPPFKSLEPMPAPREPQKVRVKADN
jgi:hypothetical protein